MNGPGISGDSGYLSRNHCVGFWVRRAALVLEQRVALFVDDLLGLDDGEADGIVFVRMGIDADKIVALRFAADLLGDDAGPVFQPPPVFCGAGWIVKPL